MADGIQHAVSEFVHRFPANTRHLRVTPQNLLKLRWVQFGQLTLRNALDCTKVSLPQTLMANGWRQAQCLCDDFSGFACPHQGAAPDGGKTGIDQCGQPPTAMGRSSVSQFSLRGKSVVTSADADVLLAWVRENPAVRSPLVAAEINIHCTDKHGNYAWSPIAASLLDIAPNRQDVLDGFAKHFHPMCWSGSIANVLRPYQGLVTRLVNGEDAGIAMWAIDRIHRCVEVMTELNFLGDEKTQGAVIRNFAILGEAAHSIEIFHAKFAAAHPQVTWALMYTRRNRVAHRYFKVDFELVWKTIHVD